MNETQQEIEKLSSKLKTIKFGVPFELRIDNCEPPWLKDHFRDYKFVTYKTMDVGDIHLCVNGSPLFVIERKSTADLSGAIGKRHSNQKARLKQLSLPRHQIIYLIEKSHVHPRFNKGLSRLMGAKVNILVRDKMSVFETQYKSETIYFILKMILKVQQHHKLYKMVEPSTETRIETGSPTTQDDKGGEKMSYLKTLTTNKQKNLTPDLCYLEQLACIKSCGPSRAMILKKRFPTMIALCEYLKGEKEEVITGLSNLTSEKGRRVGRVGAQTVYDYLHQ